MTGYLEMSAQRRETRLLAMISGLWMSRLIGFSVQEGVIATLAEQPHTAMGLAHRLGFQPQVTERLLEGLVHLGLAQQGDGKYALTEDGALLSPEADSGFASMSRLWNGIFDGAWTELAGTARIGKAGFELHHGMPIFAKIGGDSELAPLFDDAMRGLAQLVACEVAEVLAPRGLPLLCDIGGGNGMLLSQILAASPETRGILFDRAGVVQAAAEGLDISRIQAVGGDFFESVPEAPAHILSNIIHDWSDTDAGRILENVRAAQPRDGTLYLVEMMLGGAAEPLLARSTDLNMLMLTGGRERREAEFAEILGASGFRIKGVRQIAGLTCLLEACKA